jgi:probable blue pigment (indigoidine) exporter
MLGQTLGPIQLAGFGLALAAIVAGQLPAPSRSSHIVSTPEGVLK